MPKRVRLQVVVALGLLGGGAVVVGWKRWAAEQRQGLPPTILQDIAAAQERHREKLGVYAGSLAGIGAVDSHWSSGLYERDYNGYSYEVGPAPEGWSGIATPVANPGWRHYYVDGTGVVRWEQGRPAGVRSPVFRQAAR